MNDEGTVLGLTEWRVWSNGCVHEICDMRQMKNREKSQSGGGSEPTWEIACKPLEGMPLGQREWEPGVGPLTAGQPPDFRRLAPM